MGVKSLNKQFLCLILFRIMLKVGAMWPNRQVEAQVVQIGLGDSYPASDPVEQLHF